MPPILHRDSLSVAIVTGLQYTLPGLCIALTLVALTQWQQWPLNPFLSGLAAFAWLLVSLTLRPSVRDTPELQAPPTRLIASVFIRWLALIVTLMAIGYLTGLSKNFPRRIVLPWAVLSPFIASATLLALQYVFRKITFAKKNQRSSVIVGITSSSVSLAEKLRKHPEFCSHVLGFFEDRAIDRVTDHSDFPLLGKLSELPDFVRRERVEVIFISLPIRHVERVLSLLDNLRDSTASIYYVPDVFVFDLIQSRTSDIEGVPVVAMFETPFHGYRGVRKRITDLGLTLCVLTVAIPVMAIIALLVKLTSKGPAIFRQRRYGLDGEEITVYKFRSMRVTQDGGDIPQATRDDPRITRLGRFLRRSSLDELPQLINVMQGRMSLVGPRPHAVAHNELYRKLIKGYMLRHKVRPGITGLAQVSGCRGETQDLAEMEARIRYDLDYLRHWSPTLDLQILLRTAQQLFGNSKAY
jgi:putative colanic acid biosysnthesis UDP-glucose lipid carrier transferase